MTDTRKRLEEAVAELGRIEEIRSMPGQNDYGRNQESEIIRRELVDLENEILEDPGMLEKELVWLRRARPGWPR